MMEMEKFVKANYTLEGDGALVFIAFMQLKKVRQFIHVHNFASLTHVVQQLFPLNVVKQQRWYCMV